MFFFKKIRYLFFSVFFLIFILITFFALDHENRRSIISRILVLHDFYRLKTLDHGLQVRDFSILSKKLNDYIIASKKFSKGRTYMLPGIYEATELVVSRAITQDDYNKLENIFEQLLEFDDRIYKFHIWYARAISDNDYQKALDHINIAINISPAENEAYRLAIFISQKNNDLELANKYCIKYNDEFLGGNLPLKYGTLFNSYNNQKFFLRVNNLKDVNQLNFINSNFVINQSETYEFIFDKSTNLNGVDLHIAPLSNLILNIKEMKYFSSGAEININENDLSISSNNSYIIENLDNSLNIIVSQMKEEVLRLRHKSLENIDKLEISMTIKKMQFTNSNFCKIYK